MNRILLSIALLLSATSASASIALFADGRTMKIETYAVEERSGRVWLMPPVSDTYSRSADRRAL